MRSHRCTWGLLSSAALVGCVLVVLAGPMDMQPLRFAGPQGAGPGAGNQAYYYSGGKKVLLNDTGLAVVKLKQSDIEDKSLPFATTNLAPMTPLGEMAPRLRKTGLVIVRTSGPGAVDIHTAHVTHAAHVEYTLPIVEPATGPAAAIPEGAKTHLIMTPRISARFKDLTQQQVEQYVGQSGLKIKTKLENVPDGYMLELAEGKPTYTRLLEAANRLYERGQADGKVVYSHPDFIPSKRRHGVAAAPSEPGFGDQWHLHNTGQGSGKPGADVKALGAWAITKGCPDIVVAIVDDSVDRDHPDLKPNYRDGRYYDGVAGTSTNDPSPKDGNQRHGTACAGVAVGAENGVGGMGIAPQCGLIGVNFWDATTAQTADAFYFCKNKKASVISCSWSWSAAFDDVSSAVKDVAVNGRQGKGILILFAAGNDYGTVSAYQQFGTLNEVICVGATNWRDDRSAYSNNGPEIWIAAPSSDYWDTQGLALGILTSDNRDALPKLPGNLHSGYVTGDFTPGSGPQAFGGTSSATPLAAGVCALIMSKNANLKAVDVRNILRDSADKIPGANYPANYSAQGHSVHYGYGRVNAAKALQITP